MYRAAVYIYSVWGRVEVGGGGGDLAPVDDLRLRSKLYPCQAGFLILSNTGGGVGGGGGGKLYV